MALRPLEHTAGTGFIQRLFRLSAVVMLLHQEGNLIGIPALQFQRHGNDCAAVFHVGAVPVAELQRFPG